MYKIGFDIDDTICDLLGEWLIRYNSYYGDHLRPKDITDWNITKFVTCGDKIYEFLKQDDLYDQIQPIITPFQINTIRKIYKPERVIFITNSVKGSPSKLEWLQKWGYLPEGNYSIDYVECADKQLVNVDIMIDDKPQTIMDFIENRRVGFLFDRPHNRNYTKLNYVRVYDFHSICQALDTIFELGNFDSYKNKNYKEK